MSLDVNDNVAKELKDLDINHVHSLDSELTNGESLEYYDNSQITKATVYRTHLSGIVGNFLESFEVKLSVHGQEISGKCTCNETESICRHMVALLYAWVNDGNDFLDVKLFLDKIKDMDKDRLVEVVSNIIRHNPGNVELFFSRDIPEWDEIDLEPDL